MWLFANAVFLLHAWLASLRTAVYCHARDRRNPRPSDERVVEPRRLELLTSALQRRRSPN